MSGGSEHGGGRRTSLRVRPARPGDGPGIAAALADHADFDELDDDPEAAARQVEARIPDVEDPNRTMLVVEDGVGGLAGYAHWTVTYPAFLAGPSLYLTELFVRTEHRGRGVGAALLDHLHEEAVALGASRIELVQVTSTEAHRRGFYPAHGYTVAEHLVVLRRPGTPPR